MHSYHWGANNDKWVHFHHNGDYSGDIVVVMPDKIANLEISPEVLTNSQVGTVRVNIPFGAIKALFLEYLRNKAIEDIEQATQSDLEKWAIEIFGTIEK